MWSPDGRALAATIGWRVLPALAAIMLTVTGVAVVLGWTTLAQAGVGSVRVVREYARIILWTGLAEIACLAVAACALTALAHRIAQTLGDLSAHVLHDIKTPLTRIRNEAELVFRGMTDVREGCRGIAASCTAILDLVNTNAEISRTYAGADRLPAEDVDLSALVADMVDLYSGIAEEKGVAVAYARPAEPVVFTGHRHRLQPLVLNLLDNALKYSPAGGEVAVALRREAGAVVLVVADEGPGVPAEALPHIFKRFYRADPGRHGPGFGLGLALVHAVATSYRGTVRCESEPGRGAAFTVTLPTVSRAGRTARRGGGGPSR